MVYSLIPTSTTGYSLHPRRAAARPERVEKEVVMLGKIVAAVENTIVV